MNRVRIMMVVIAGLIAVAPSMAFIFGPSSSSIAEVHERYFLKEEADISDYLTIDLAIIESDRDARVLYRVLKGMVRDERSVYGDMVDELELRAADVERLAGILYAKEVQDELWEQTRPLKQAAYRAALEGHDILFHEIRSRGTRILKAEFVRDALRHISRRFKAVAP